MQNFMIACGFWDSWRLPLAQFYTKTIYASLLMYVAMTSLCVFPSFWYTTCPYNKYNIYKYSICIIFQIYRMAAILIFWPYHHIFTPIIFIYVVMNSPWYYLHFDILHAHITNIFNFHKFLDWSHGGHFEFSSVWGGETQLFSC